MKYDGEYLRLQRRCQKILDELNVPQTNSFALIRDWVEEWRGRPLILKELPEQIAMAGACGLWLSTDEADYVFYEARTARLHTEHIILHELGHMLCDHHGAEDPTQADPLNGLLSGLQPQLIKRLMARTSYTTTEEQEAEMIASLIHTAGEAGRPGGALGRLGAFLGVTADDSE
ncbi:regulator component [Streptomyces hygroscopicus]|nr:regulator component [Streptomyces hygroscopicus]